MLICDEAGNAIERNGKHFTLTISHLFGSMQLCQLCNKVQFMTMTVLPSEIMHSTQ